MNNNYLVNLGSIVEADILCEKWRESYFSSSLVLISKSMGLHFCLKMCAKQNILDLYVIYMTVPEFLVASNQPSNVLHFMEMTNYCDISCS